LAVLPICNGKGTWIHKGYA